MSAWKTKRTSGLSTPMPKAIGRAHHDAVLAQEGVLVGRARGVVEAGVIGQRAPPWRRKFARQLFGALARGAIDDAALARVRFQPLASWRVALAFGRIARKGSAGRTSARRLAAGAENSRSAMSSRVGASAVAVTAIAERRRAPRAASRRRRYSGRKSWPHCETQCASSMAKRRARLREHRQRVVAQPAVRARHRAGAAALA